MVDFENTPPAEQPKITPGWQTSEFWLNLVAIVVSYLITTNAFAQGSWQAQALAIVATVLLALGYTGARAGAKAQLNSARIEYMKLQREQLKLTHKPEE